MFRRFFSHKPTSLAGSPAVRRVKNYSAQSGYVYRYFYEGHRVRPGREENVPTEFVFGVSADRKSWIEIAVVVSSESLASWETDHGRRLSPTERYAVAKMALFQAFDERPTPAHMKQDVLVRPADVEAIVERLGL